MKRRTVGIADGYIAPAQLGMNPPWSNQPPAALLMQWACRFPSDWGSA